MHVGSGTGVTVAPQPNRGASRGTAVASGSAFADYLHSAMEVADISEPEDGKKPLRGTKHEGHLQNDGAASGEGNKSRSAPVATERVKAATDDDVADGANTAVFLAVESPVAPDFHFEGDVGSDTAIQKEQKEVEMSSGGLDVAAGSPVGEEQPGPRRAEAAGEEAVSPVPDADRRAGSGPVQTGLAAAAPTAPVRGGVSADNPIRVGTAVPLGPPARHDTTSAAERPLSALRANRSTVEGKGPRIEGLRPGTRVVDGRARSFVPPEADEKDGDGQLLRSASASLSKTASQRQLQNAAPTAGIGPEEADLFALPSDGDDLQSPSTIDTDAVISSEETVTGDEGFVLDGDEAEAGDETVRFSPAAGGSGGDSPGRSDRGGTVPTGTLSEAEPGMPEARAEEESADPVSDFPRPAAVRRDEGGRAVETETAAPSTIEGESERSSAADDGVVFGATNRRAGAMGGAVPRLAGGVDDVVAAAGLDGDETLPSEIDAAQTPTNFWTVAEALDAETDFAVERDPDANLSTLAERLQELAETIVRERGPGGEERVTIKLHPEHLGRLVLHVGVDEAGVVHARFAADNAMVRAMIEQDLPQLRASLEANGLVLGDAGVEADAGSGFGAEQGGLFADDGPSSHGRGTAGASDSTSASAPTPGGDEESADPVLSASAIGNIDIRI